jgi:hypothetical protein
MKTVRAYVDGCYVGQFELLDHETESGFGNGQALIRFAKERGISPVGVSLRPYKNFYYKTDMATGGTKRVYL